MTRGFYVCCALSLVDLVVTHRATRLGFRESSLLLRKLGPRPNPLLSLAWRAGWIGGFVLLEHLTRPQPPLWWFLSALLAAATVWNVRKIRGAR